MGVLGNLKILLVAFCFLLPPFSKANTETQQIVFLKDSILKYDYSLEGYFEYVQGKDCQIKNDFSYKNFFLKEDIIKTNIYFERVSFDGFAIRNSNIQSKLNLTNIQFKTDGFINESKINYLLISNLTGSRIIIHKCRIDTLDVLVLPDSSNSVQFLLDSDTINFLRIPQNEYFTKSPVFSMNSVVFNKMEVHESFISNNDFTLCNFYPKIELVQEQTNKVNLLKLKMSVLNSLALQYKNHGNYGEYIKLKAELKKLEIGNERGFIQYFWQFFYEFLGGSFFIYPQKIVMNFLITILFFTALYLFIGIFQEFGKIYETNHLGEITSGEKKEPIRALLYRDYYKKYKGSNIKHILIIKDYLMDCLLFTINHFFILRTDQTHNISHLFWYKPRTYVAIGKIGKSISFIQFLIGLCFAYSMTLAIYNIIQKTI